MFLGWKRSRVCAPCILRYLGRGRGPGTVSIIVSERVAAPFFAFRSTLAHTILLFTSRRSRTAFILHLDSGNREEVTTSLSYGHGVSVWTRWEGDNARESRATVRWVWESRVKQSRNLALLSQEMHVNTRRMESNSRNEDFEEVCCCLGSEIFHSNLFPCS